MRRTDLKSEEFNPYYSTYIKLVDGDKDLIEALEYGKEKTQAYFESIPSEKWKYAYAEGKWSLLEVLQHIIDTERIFSYRALCIARNDKTEFPGFEQDDYVKPSNANNRTMEDLLLEYNAVRKSSILLFKGLDEESLTRIGKASSSPISARAAGFIIAGHEIHHANIITERYL
tara:strand:- start:710 stop:1228 length:519 start_codon:yes stop_codon:yes gene_type:complete